MAVACLVLEFVRALAWPVLVLVLCLTYRRQVLAVFDRLRRAELPGGFAVDLAQDLKEAKALSLKVLGQPLPPDRHKGKPTIPLTEANARMIELGLRPSPSGLDMTYYRNLASQDPNIALAGLRIELDILARNLAKGFKITTSERDSGSRLIRRLYESAAISDEQMRLTLTVLKVCNSAVHGDPISRETAEKVIDIAEVLSDQYLAWLSWGFDDNWQPNSGA